MSTTFSSVLQEPTPFTTINWEDIQRFFYLGLAFMDIAYVFYAFCQYRFGPGKQYPHPKWTMTPIRKVTIVCHIVGGVIAMYIGTIFCLVLEFAPTIVSPSFILIASYTTGASILFHSLSSLPMSLMPFGNRQFTVPGYVFHTLVNTAQAICLLIDPTNAHQLLLAWGSINVFVLVRLQIAIQYLGGVDVYHSGYLYAMVTSTLVYFLFSHQNPIACLLLLVIPGVFGKWAAGVNVPAFKAEKEVPQESDERLIVAE
ncbi:hypothetical protein HDU98_007207 [Podochytrium sp. JEL0797]|nr:hypothetical protein HDU98_007207 [Podochytrium sp. JEL0797]